MRPEFAPYPIAWRQGWTVGLLLLRREMERGAYPTIRALANAKGLSDSYVWKILRLGYLAPDIVEAILDGRQPSHLSLHNLNLTKLPGDWGSQRHALGLPELT